MVRILKCCVLFYLLPTTYYLLCYAYPPGWSDDILLSPEDPKQRSNPALDVDAYHNVWAVWDTTTWVQGTGEVLYSKRDSLGACLIPETGVSNNASYSLGPRIAVDASNNTQIVWRDQTPQGMGLWHATLANDGTVIVPAHLAVSGSNDGFPINIALNKHKEINVIWDEMSSGYNQTNYTKLDSVGNPIIPKIKVSLDTFYTYWGGIGIDSMANNHLGYRTDDTVSAYRLTYSKLDKDGNILIDNIFLGFGYHPVMIADQSQNIHMVYGDHTGPGSRIEYLKLDQEANILVGPITLSIYEDNARPHMAMDSLQYLHVVWDTDSAGVFPIMYTKLDTLGDFVISPMQVVYPPYTQGGGMARIAVDRSNRLHLVWVDDRLNPGVSTDIFYKRGDNEPGIEEQNQSEPLKPLNITVMPNPFTHRIIIRYSILDTRYMINKNALEIYDATGRFVTSFDIESSAENQELDVLWDGKDFLGRALPDGVYFLTFTAGNYSTTEKLLLIR